MPRLQRLPGAPASLSFADESWRRLGRPEARRFGLDVSSLDDRERCPDLRILEVREFDSGVALPITVEIGVSHGEGCDRAGTAVGQLSQLGHRKLLVAHEFPVKIASALVHCP